MPSLSASIPFMLSLFRQVMPHPNHCPNPSPSPNHNAQRHKHDLVKDDALKAWKDDVTRISDNKQKAIVQTMNFFEFMLSEDDEGGEDDDGDEDITPAHAI